MLCLLHLNISRDVTNRNANVAFVDAMQVSVVNGKRYKSTHPVPWHGSVSPKDRDIRLACQQLHISRYDRESKTWLQEHNVSMMSHLASNSCSLHMKHAVRTSCQYWCSSCMQVPHIQAIKVMQTGASSTARHCFASQVSNNLMPH